MRESNVQGAARLQWQREEQLRQFKVLLAEAEAPSTSAERLAAIAETASEEFEGEEEVALQEAVTCHPNTSPELLIRLAAHYPLAFVRNPVTPLLLLEQPEYLDDLMRLAEHGLIRQELLPASLVNALLTQRPSKSRESIPGFEEDLRQHVSIAAPFSEADGADWYAELIAALGRLANGDKDPSLAEGLREMHDASPLPAWALASLPPDAGVVEPDRSPESDDIRTARDPKTNTEVLRRLARSSEVAVRVAAAANPTTPGFALHLLVQEGRWQPEVRRAVAANPSTPLTVLQRLADDLEYSIRRAVASHPNADAAVWEKCNDLRRYLGSNTAPLCRFLAQLRLGVTQPGRLSKLGYSLCWLDCLAAALLLPADAPEREVLAADGNRLVRAAARYPTFAQRFKC